MVESIAPRPIAWISTRAKDGSTNLAPFSFFNAVASEPPTLVVSITPNRSGADKDTLKNIRETSQWVVNLADDTLLQKLHQTSAEYPYGVSEFKEAGLTEAKSLLVNAPRVAESPIQLECKLVQLVEVGQGGRGSSTLAIGEIVAFHFNDEIFKNGHVDAEAYRPIARLGGPNYSLRGEIIVAPPVRITP